jgi:hypothetical protein
VKKEASSFLPAVGLCSACRWGRLQPSGRGRGYWRCLRAEREPGYTKYPPLPVLGCDGFEARPQAEPDGAASS